VLRLTVKTLQECRIRRDRLKRLEESIERLESAMTRVTQILSHAPARGVEDERLDEQIDQLINLTATYARRTVELELMRAKVTEWIDTLPEQQAQVIFSRYVEGLSWAQVARRTNYSKDHCFTIHRAALRKCEEERT